MNPETLDDPLLEARAYTTHHAKKRRHSFWRIVLDWFLVIIFAIAMAWLSRAYVAQTFFIPSGSMAPTLQVGDRIIVDKLFSTIHTGDIIVFRRAPRDTQMQYADLVKRVIGLPGQRVSWTGNTVRINGHSIPEPWLPQLVNQCANVPLPVTKGSITVPAGNYFVMGDCRGDSDDSRYWGTVPAANIIGKVDAIVWQNGHPWFHWF